MKNKCRKLIFLLFSSSRVDLFVKKQNCRNLSLIWVLPPRDFSTAVLVLSTGDVEHRVCSFQRIQKRIFDPRFARFRGRKEREIRNWICTLGNLSPMHAICTTASHKMTCFLLFDKLCDYTVQNLVVGSSNSDDGTYQTDKERSPLKLKII